jgi:hypothetical protein
MVGGQSGRTSHIRKQARAKPVKAALNRGRRPDFSVPNQAIYRVPGLWIKSLSGLS